MKVDRAASIPLVVHDPYFSIWSSADRLYDKDTVHWSGIRQKIQGILKIDGVEYVFMGVPEEREVITQSSLDVTATATEYVFENEKVSLKVCFTSPLLLDDMVLVSRPVTYIDFEVTKKTDCEAELSVCVTRDLVSQDWAQIVGGVYLRNAKGESPAYKYAYMGRSNQRPLGGSGDRVTIDWGYVYLADAHKDSELTFSEDEGCITWKRKLSDETERANLVIAYDDILSINYFGQWRRGYWTKKYATILDAVGSAISDREETLARAAAFDEEVYKKALAIGGEDYALLCNFSYRQVVGAHKLICDEEGNLIFLSKENDSNGCVGTVDVSYPSVPLFLMYNTEYVKGMLRPIFKFAECDVWEADYAPHDVGRYPYAWGQVYGVWRKHIGSLYPRTAGRVRPPFYSYPAGNHIYDEKMQMPVEECANMLIMTAEVCRLDGNAGFAEPYKETLEKWVKYLITYGADPGEQLCTDDFAGHLAHNTNLSIKAIMGIAAYAMLQAQFGNEEAGNGYHEIAQKMAADWEKRAYAGDHYSLTFGDKETWSLKYNLVWDLIWKSNLFSVEVFEKELAWYETKINTYGTPLDSRKTYTKSDWICWCAAMTREPEQMRNMIAPVARYLRETKTRVPFGDWYDSVTGKYEHFIGRSVQGGIYMPIFKEWSESRK